MKRLLFALPAICICALLSCSGGNSGGMSATAKKNLDACNAINAAILSGDVSKLGDYISADAVDHSGGRGDIKGLDSIKASLASIHNMSTDMKVVTIKELADDDYVFQWQRFTGTSSSADMGMPAGTKYDMAAIEVSKMKDGKAIEHWEFLQPSDMMKMMSQSQQATMSNMPDSTNHK
ncbi:MAG TPA: ester cyclase [Chitinophagaceae bacterium]|jgi:hypothetical protein|nr:ester cyclase [Chitinophagaceae bacterium]